MEDAPVEALVNSWAMALPFDAAELQAILEADTLDARRETLITLLEIDGASFDDDRPQVQ